MERNRYTRVLALATVSVIALGSVSLAQEVPTTGSEPPSTTPVTSTTTDTGGETPVVSDDGVETEEGKQGPGVAVSSEAKLLQEIEGPRKDAAKQLRATALANNPGYQAAVAKRTPKPGEEEEDGATSSKTSHPTADDHPGKDDHPNGDDNPGVDDHPTPDDHPDETDNPGDLASADHGRPDDLPEPDDRPGKDDHPTGRPGGG